MLLHRLQQEYKTFNTPNVLPPATKSPTNNIPRFVFMARIKLREAKRPEQELLLSLNRLKCFLFLGFTMQICSNGLNYYLCYCRQVYAKIGTYLITYLLYFCVNNQ